MGKGKLIKFEQMKSFSNVYQYPFAAIKEKGFPFKGKWHSEVFKNDNPIVLELGCGKGDYAVALSRKFPDKNFIGIDIKGARMWKGAKEAIEDGINNVRFVRTQIELIHHFFAEKEVQEIWLTFPDPQMQKVRKRLTATNFIELYRNLLTGNGIIHLKTDSDFQYGYTKSMIEHNAFTIVDDFNDIYTQTNRFELVSIQTYYESQWLSRGKKIKYISFIPHQRKLEEPEVDIEFDDYRSYGREKRSEKTAGK